VKAITFAGRQSCDVESVEQDRAGGAGEPDDRVHQFALAVALDAGDADDLAPMHREGDVGEQLAGADVGVRNGQVPQLEHRYVGDRAVASLRCREFAADHHLGEFA
jgi:hypothetical protein